MAILKSAIIFILIGYLIVLLPVLLRYIKNQKLQREKLKRPPVEPTNNSIIVDGHTHSLPSNLSPLNFTSYTHSIGFDGHPMESDSSPRAVRQLHGVDPTMPEIQADQFDYDIQRFYPEIIPTFGAGIRWISNHEISDEQITQKETGHLLKDIQGKANKDPVKLKTRFELLKE